MRRSKSALTTCLTDLAGSCAGRASGRQGCSAALVMAILTTWKWPSWSWQLNSTPAPLSPLLLLTHFKLNPPLHPGCSKLRLAGAASRGLLPAGLCRSTAGSRHTPSCPQLPVPVAVRRGRCHRAGYPGFMPPRDSLTIGDSLPDSFIS